MFHLMIPLAGVDVWWPGLIFLGLFIGFLTGMFGIGIMVILWDLVRKIIL